MHLYDFLSLAVNMNMMIYKKAKMSYLTSIVDFEN